MTSSERNITAEDVKDKLFQSLKSRGVLDSLKSQLRKQLIWELQDTAGLPVLGSGCAKPSNKDHKSADGSSIPLFKRISNSIVAEHLKRCNYEYTLSTFLPESRTSSDKMFADKDILHLLRINSESKLYKNMEHTQSSSRDSKGFLWQFILEIASLHNNSQCDAENQTEETLSTRTGSLEEKLSEVEKEFSEKARLFQLDKDQGIEEKLIAVQKKYEEQKRKELQEEIKKFKANQMSRIKLEEREKYEAEVKKMRREYDQEFNLKHQALRAMEKEMLERMKRQQEVQECEAYAERQKTLQEMHSFKQGQADLKSRIELQERSQKVEEDRLQNETGQLKALEGALKEKEKFQEQKYKEEVERFKIDYEKQFTTRRQELLRQESRLEAGKLIVKSEREKYLQCQDDITAYREKNVELQTSVETARILLENINKQKMANEEKLATMKDYASLKEKEIIFKKDIEHLTQRLADTNTYLKEQEKKQQKLVKELTAKAGKPSKEVVALRKELKDVKNQFKLKQKSSNEARRNLENRLNTEIQNSNYFQNLYEDQLISQRLMETEIANFKMMQQQTEQLLNMERRQQKKNDSDMSSPSSRKDNVKKTTTSSRVDSQVDSQEISIWKYETDGSSTVDENSLVSLAEDKKIFEKLESEAEALDASYRDFQNRVRASQQHTVGSMPSSMSFRRLPSYHSLHSQVWLNPTVPQDKPEYRPLTLYRESSISDHVPLVVKDKRHWKSSVHPQSSLQRLSSARMQYQIPQANLPNHDSNEMLDTNVESRKLPADETDVLTVKHLNEVPSSSTTHSKDIEDHEQITRGSLSSIAGVVVVENQKETELLFTQNVVSPKERHSRKEHRSRNRTELKDKEHVSVDTYNDVLNKSDRGFAQNHTIPSNAENMAANTKTSNASVASSVGQLKSKSENSIDGAVRSISRTSDKAPGHGSKVDYSEEHESGELLGSAEETTLDGMWERRDGQGDNRTSGGSLDMDELEERRRKDVELPNVGIDHPSQSKKVSGESLDELEQESSEDDSLDPSFGDEELELPTEKNDHDKNGEADKLVNEGHSQDPTIDPMMLKYMEMIKQRRENETNHKDVDSSVSLGKEDDDVSTPLQGGPNPNRYDSGVDVDTSVVI